MPPDGGHVQPHEHWIGGASCPPSLGQYFDVVEPDVDRVFARAAHGSVADVDAAVRAAHAAFSGFSTAPVNVRESILSRAAALLERDAEEFAALMVREVGSPISKARNEVQRSVDVLRAASGATRYLSGRTLPSDSPKKMNLTFRVPLGVVASITPFNVPLAKGVRLSAIPLAFGNTVVMLPSEESPLMALRLARLYQEAGLPRGCLNVVTGFGHEIGDALTGHPLVRSISFTGSTRVGAHIRDIAARTGKKLTLELGGKSPLVVLNDADLPRAVTAAIQGAFTNQGQICMAFAPIGAKLLQSPHNLSPGTRLRCRQPKPLTIRTVRRTESSVFWGTTIRLAARSLWLAGALRGRSEMSRIRSRIFTSSAGLLAGLLVGLGGGGALAQEATLDEVVVTATKREVNLQDVALSVTALTGEALEANAVKRFDDIDMPAVSIGQGGANDALFIRGVGSGFNPGFDQSAPMFIDGTWFGQAQSQRLAFLDVARVEILKGPQPTYLGKNAIAGAFSVVSRRPTDELSGSVDVSYETEAKERAVAASLSGPLADGLSARVAIKASEMDGYMRNLATLTDNPARKDRAARLSLLWNPNERFEAFAKYETLKYEESSRTTQLLRCLPTAPRDSTVEDCQFDLNRAVRFDRTAYHPVATPFFTYRNGEPENQHLELRSGQLQLVWKGDIATVTSVTSYYQQNNELFTKPDHSTLQRNAIETANVGRLFSQELRFTSAGADALQWLAGVYFDDQHLDDLALQGRPAMGGRGTNSGSQQDANTRSVFAEVSYEFAADWTARVGARYSEIEKDAVGFSTNIVSNPMAITIVGPTFAFPLVFSYEDDSFEPALTLEWRPADDRMLYASWRKGFKAGGIDLSLGSVRPADFVFRPEEVSFLEAGGKFMFRDGSVRLNASAFRGEYDDLQVTQLDANTGNFRTINAASVVSQGIELDAAWAIAQGVTLTSAVTYLDSTYESFPGAQCWQNPAQTVAQGCVQVGTVGAVRVFAQDLAGSRTSFAPEWSGTFGAEVRRSLGASLFGGKVDFVGSIDVFFTDEFNTNFDSDPLTVQESFYKLGARIGLTSVDDRWQLMLIGRNLNDELTSHWIANVPGGGNAKFAQTDRPREIALQFRYSF